MAVWPFFSLQPRLPKTAQNSPELNIHFIDSCIQWSVVLYLGLYKKRLVIFRIMIKFYLILKTIFFSFIRPKRRLKFRRKCLVQKTHAYVLHRDTGLPHPCWRKKRSSYRRFWFCFHGQFSQKHQIWYILTSWFFI